MPVEDRIRRGLEANARAFVPEGEQRLVQVHRRARTRTRALAAATLIAAVATLAAGSLLWGPGRPGSPVPAQQPTQAVTSENAYAGPRIADSGWRRVVTRAEFLDAGADDAWIADNLGRADRLPITVDFLGTVFSQSQRHGGGWRVGDAGTLDYDLDGRLVLTSTAPGCRGCVMSLKWRMLGDRLELSDFRGTPDDPISRVLYEGIWTRI